MVHLIQSTRFMRVRRDLRADENIDKECSWQDTGSCLLLRASTAGRATLRLLRCASLCFALQERQAAMRCKSREADRACTQPTSDSWNCSSSAATCLLCCKEAATIDCSLSDMAAWCSIRSACSAAVPCTSASFRLAWSAVRSSAACSWNSRSCFCVT